MAGRDGTFGENLSTDDSQLSEARKSARCIAALFKNGVDDDGEF